MFNAELRPYLPAIHILSARLSGEDASLSQLHSITENLDKLNEAQLITELLSLNCFLYRYENEQGQDWDIVLENYEAFTGRSKKVIRSELGFDADKTQRVYQWLIMLCDWDGSCVLETITLQ